MPKFIICIIVLFAVNSFARWVPNTEAPIIIDQSNANYEVKSDGSFVMEESLQFTAKNEAGRNQLALHTISFHPDLEQVEIIKASSVTDGFETAVNLNAIHVRTAPGPPGGVTGLRELVIPFTNLKIGSSIRYLARTRSKAAHAGSFFEKFAYGAFYPESSGVVKIRSERELYYAVRDNEHVLHIEKGKENNWFTLTISQVKPVTKALQGETFPIFRQDSFSQVHVSTLKSWKDYNAIVAPKYEKVLSEPLPQSLKAIAEKARLKQNFHDKIDTVTSELATIMTYAGNWVTTEKMFYPNSLADIGRQKTGDCKDFSTATVAILRSMNIPATVAFVFRKSPYDPAQVINSSPLQSNVILPSLFNHAIVRIQSDKKTWWVDPTNPVSNSRIVFPDIVRSYALNVTDRTSYLEQIPENPDEASTLNIEKSLKISADGTGETVGTIGSTGIFSVIIQNAFIQSGTKEGKVELLNYYSSILQDVETASITGNSVSRIGNSLSVGIRTYGEKIYSEKKEKKFLLAPLPKPLELFTSSVTRGRVTDLYTISPGQYSSKIRVEGYDIEEMKSQGCLALNRWVDVERKILKTTKGFDIIDKVNFETSYISAGELNGTEFRSAMGDVYNCYSAETLSIRKLGPSETLTKRLGGYTIDNMDKMTSGGGPEAHSNFRIVKMISDQLLHHNPRNREAQIWRIRAIKNLGYQSGETYTSEFLKLADDETDQLLKAQPDYVPALIQKSYSLIRNGSLEEAKKYFSKAYYASSKKTYEIYVLGSSLAEKNQMWKVAEGSQLKALSIAQTNDQKTDAHSALKNIYSTLGDNQKSEYHLMSALKLQPKNAWLMNDVLLLAMEKNDFEGAIEVGEKMLSISDFGVGRANLARAYGHRAQQTLDKAKRDVTAIDKSIDFGLKGLKWDENSTLCLVALGSAYHQMSILKKDAIYAKRAQEMGEKALSRSTNAEDVAIASAFLNKLNSPERHPQHAQRVPAQATKTLDAKVKLPIAGSDEER